jgi:hypothetical protein
MKNQSQIVNQENGASSHAAQQHGNAADFEATLRASMDELLLKTRAHQDAWGFGEEDQWCLDQGSGEVVFTFPDCVISAPAQVIGTLDAEQGTWTWAWADPAVPDHLKSDSWRLREYGEEHGFQHLVTRTWAAEESHCWYMAALACSLCQAQGVFRGITGSLHAFVSFYEPKTVSVSEGAEEPNLDVLSAEAAEEFKVSIDDPDEQRQACIRYLKRGAVAGFPQDELIHRLGLWAPSVLDLAGYPAELADNVMGMLKTITDEEIDSCLV